MNDALLPFKRCYDFRGRSRRREFWLFVLLVHAVVVMLTAVEVGLGFYSHTVWWVGPLPVGSYSPRYHLIIGLLITLLYCVAALPLIAVSIRRLHDSDRQGRWYLFGIVPVVGLITLVVVLCLKGTRGPNRFGADPRDASHVA